MGRKPKQIETLKVEREYLGLYSVDDFVNQIIYAHLKQESGAQHQRTKVESNHDTMI